MIMSNDSVHGNVGGEGHSHNRGDDHGRRGAPKVWDDQMQDLVNLITNMGNQMNQMETTQQQIVTQLAQQHPVANGDRIVVRHILFIGIRAAQVRARV